jgi:hypothetical protein
MKNNNQISSTKSQITNPKSQTTDSKLTDNGLKRVFIGNCDLQGAIYLSRYEIAADL